MLASVNWLKELLKLSDELSVETIAQKLTLAGLEVEAIDDLDQRLHDIVVARVLAVDPHPDADRLRVCHVDIGDATVTVVCGAPNVAVDARVALARPGAELGGTTIRVAKLRGVESHGMLCSEKELGVGEDGSGLLLLDESAAVGAPVAQVLGVDRVVMEVGITPNRPDALSHVGLARELAALTGARLKLPAAVPAERGGPIDDAAAVRIEDAEACPRYACRVVEDVQVGPSPLWLQQRLKRCGVRSINNVVDATNLVLLERGHPLHAFDADRLGRERGKATVVVRRAKQGEKLTTLDGVERDLDVDDLLICDPDRPIALAGVMGGADSEVGDSTSTVLIESAYFVPSVVRRSARRHGVHTEASHRFERGCDPNRGLEESLHRVAMLIAELTGGVVRRGVIDVYPKKIEPRQVRLRPARVASLLGLPEKIVNEAEISKMLSALGLEVASREGDAIHLRVPTWRPDLTREVDLIEEVLRLHGMDQIEATLPRGSGKAAAPMDYHGEHVVQRLQCEMLAAGFNEAVTLSFTSPDEAALFAKDAGPEPVRIANALGEEQSCLRQTLLVRLLSAVAHNQRRDVEDVRLFEAGTVFAQVNPQGQEPRPDDPDGPTGGDAYAIEAHHLAAVSTGRADPIAFDSDARPYDFFDLKAVIENLLRALGLSARDFRNTEIAWVPVDDEAWLHPRCACRIRVGGVDLGLAGELHPDVAEAMGVKGHPVAFELDVDRLTQVARMIARYRPLARFPRMRRDLALLVDDAATVDQMLDVVRGCDAARRGLLVDVEVFDVYRGKHVAPGKKSVALGFEYRSNDRTLVENEVNALHAAVVDKLVRALRAEVRA